MVTVTCYLCTEHTSITERLPESGGAHQSLGALKKLHPEKHVFLMEKLLLSLLCTTSLSKTHIPSLERQFSETRPLHVSEFLFPREREENISVDKQKGEI